MNRLLYKIVTVLLAAVLISSAFGVTALADELRAGTVAGLPEKLVVLDDKGNSVSENGEYYFQVEGMKASEHYTKKIQIMNQTMFKMMKMFMLMHHYLILLKQ